MGSIDIIKPLSPFRRSAVNKSEQYQEKNYWERQESNLELLGEKPVCYLCAMKPPDHGLNCKAVISDTKDRWNNRNRNFNTVTLCLEKF